MKEWALYIMTWASRLSGYPLSDAPLRSEQQARAYLQIGRQQPGKAVTNPCEQRKSARQIKRVWI
jgi:hypothetical protein